MMSGQFGSRVIIVISSELQPVVLSHGGDGVFARSRGHNWFETRGIIDVLRLGTSVCTARWQSRTSDRRGDAICRSLLRIRLLKTRRL